MTRPRRSGGLTIAPARNSAAASAGSRLSGFHLVPKQSRAFMKSRLGSKRSLNWEYPPDPGPWRQAECDAFNAAARDLYEVIANELGATFVVDFHQEPLKEHPELDVYLQNKPPSGSNP